MDVDVRNCPNGHPMVPENIYTDPAGYGHCRACNRQRVRAHYHKRKAERAAATGQESGH